MANHKSAKKRAKQNEVRKERNKVQKSKTRTMVKKVRDAIEAKNKDLALTLFKEAQSLLAKLGQSQVSTLQTAARKISRLATQINKI